MNPGNSVYNIHFQSSIAMEILLFSSGRMEKPTKVEKEPFKAAWHARIQIEKTRNDDRIRQTNFNQF
jgi:hypothetical protein